MTASDQRPSREELLSGPTPVQEMGRLRAVLGKGPRLLVKRDDAIPFGFGGNKVRKLEFVLPEALTANADTLVTLGGVQSNHARATAAAAAKLGLRCVLIINGAPQDRPSGNALLDRLLGAEVEYIASRAERAGAVERVMSRLQSAHSASPRPSTRWWLRGFSRTSSYTRDRREGRRQDSSREWPGDV